MNATALISAEHAERAAANRAAGYRRHACLQESATRHAHTEAYRAFFAGLARIVRTAPSMRRTRVSGFFACSMASACSR